MRIGIVSDIHCNAAGLRTALDLMGDVHELVCVGDSIFQFRFSNEVVALLRECGAHVILGNHEATFFSRDGERARNAPTNDRGLMDWLAGQPMTIDTRINSKRLFVVHGSPWAPYQEYVYPSHSGFSRFAGFEADYVLLGHTHHQMEKRVGDVTVINPGSTGDARDPRNGNRLSFAVLDTASGEVRFCNYDDPARPRTAASPAPEPPEWTDDAV
jgi:putative phosphoesterase